MNMDKTLAPLAIAPRITRLREQLAARNLDALLVTKLANVRYLTGFTGSAALLLVATDDALFVTDGRYTEQSNEQLAGAGVAAGAGGDVRIEIGLTASAQHALVAAMVAPGARLGLEDHSVTWADQRGYVATFEGAELVPAGAIVEDLRRVKDAGEVDRIRRACAIADDAFLSLSSMLAE